MELPRPNSVIYMDIDLETCLNQMKARQEKTKTTGDIHETHSEYLAACLRAGRAASKRLGWNSISCLNNGQMRSISDIHEEVYKAVKEAM